MNLFKPDKTEVTETQLAWEQARKAFFRAIVKNDVEKISAIAAQYSDAVNWKDGKGRPPLHAAL